MSSGPRVVYLVQPVHWVYNDAFHDPHSGVDPPVRAFADRAAAEAFRARLQAEVERGERPSASGVSPGMRDSGRAHGVEYFEFEIVEAEWEGGA